MVQEAIDSSKINKERGMTVNIGMANAFDKVRFSFLFQVLEKSGFNNNFTSLTKACVSGP